MTYDFKERAVEARYWPARTAPNGEVFQELFEKELRAAYAAGMREAAVYSSTRFIEASLMNAADAIERGEP